MRGSKQSLTLYLMLAPYLGGIVFLVLIPAGLSIVFIFTRYNALSAPEWVGWENFQQLWQDRLAYITIGNTLFYLILAVILRLVGAFILALIFSRYSGGPVARTIVFMPTIIPQIAYAFIWLVALNPKFGPFNLLTSAVGLPEIAWLAEPWTARIALIFMIVWRLGEGFIVMLVSLGDIPEHLYENAILDGANEWAKFRYITLPLLLPRLLLLSAWDTMVVLQASFVPTLILTNGGPGYATLFIPLYSYLLAFDDLHFGYAATLIWITYLLTLLLIIIQYAASRRMRYEGPFA